MTDEASGSGDAAPSDRESRLQALLSVDVGGSGPDAPSVVDATDLSIVEDAADETSVADRSTREVGPVTTEISKARIGAAMWVVLAILLLAGGGLVYAGTSIVRSSTTGRVLEPIDDPTTPGFEAVVEPTPTLVLLHDLDGSLDSAIVLSLADPATGQGGVILVPERTVIELPSFESNPIEVAYDLGDPEFGSSAVGFVLGAAMDEFEVVDAERWAALVAPVAPLTIENPNEIVVDDVTRFQAGEIVLAADDVGPYLEARIEGESDLARLFRHEIFWRAWLDAVAEVGTPAAVPGELDSGIGRFVRALAASEAEVQTLPVQPATPGRYGDEPAFVPRFDQIEELVGRFIPFPRAAGPGLRARLRVLNGTEDTNEAAVVARDLVPAGVEIVLVGNALSLDVATTTIAYFGEEYRDEAESIREILGVGEVVVDERPSDAADITVTLGADHE